MQALIHTANQQGKMDRLHKKTRQHLLDLGVDIPKSMTYVTFVIEYQHHKASLDYMSGIKRPIGLPLLRAGPEVPVPNKCQTAYDPRHPTPDTMRDKEHSRAPRDVYSAIIGVS